MSTSFPPVAAALNELGRKKITASWPLDLAHMAGLAVQRGN